MVRVTAIIPAAGQGKRIGAGINKQYLLLAKMPLLLHTLQVFQKEPLIDEVVLVVGKDEVSQCKQELVDKYGLFKVRSILPGGKERQDSVYQGLQALSPDCRWVVVHDGARPLLTSEVLCRTIKTAREYKTAVAAVPVKDTIKVAGEDGIVLSTPDRKNLWIIQTPQVFDRFFLEKAYEKAYNEGYYGTDDASLVERLGIKVKLVIGDYENIKITTPEDLDLAEAILDRRNRLGATKKYYHK